MTIWMFQKNPAASARETFFSSVSDIVKAEEPTMLP